jgi:predicted amidohydrolase
LDNQVFAAAVSPAQTSTVYGHSMLTSPDGTVLADCGEEECCRIVDLDPALLETMRRSIPVRAGRRLDLYRLSPEQY